MKSPWRCGRFDATTQECAHGPRRSSSSRSIASRPSSWGRNASENASSATTPGPRSPDRRDRTAGSTLDRAAAFGRGSGVATIGLPERTVGEIVPSTPNEVVALIGAAAPWFRIAVVLGAGLGLRQAEAAGLTVDRIDRLGRTVLVDRQWTSRRGVCGFGPPKTESSHRSIPASSWVLDALSEHVGRRHEGFVLHRDAGPVRHGRSTAGGCEPVMTSDSRGCDSTTCATGSNQRSSALAAA
jgi:integrase